MSNRYPPPYDPYGRQYDPRRVPGAPPSQIPDPMAMSGSTEQRVGLLMPKTVVSLAIWILMFGLGAGLAGLLLFIGYQSQLNALEGRLLDTQTELEKKLSSRIDKLEKNPRQPQPSSTLNVSSVDASSRARSEAIRTTAPAIVGIEGTDSSGKATTGTGFIVNVADQESWVITNYSLVSGYRPDNLGVTVRMGNSNLSAEVYEVDPSTDLALIVVNVPGKKSLRFTRGDLKKGDTVWAFSTARGNPYATAIEAHLVDYSPVRVVVDVDPPANYNGGPIIDGQGRVVGVMSSRVGKPATPAKGTTVAPSAAPTVARTATPIKDACNIVLRCPGVRSSSQPPASPSPGASPKPSPASSPSPETSSPSPETSSPSPEASPATSPNPVASIDPNDPNPFIN